MDKQNYNFEVSADDSLRVDIETYLKEDIQFAKIKINSEEEIQFPKVDIIWYHDIIDIQSYWHPGANRNKGLTVDWYAPFSYKGTVSAPVAVFYSADKKNRLSLAYSNALDTVEFNMGVNEETGRIKCKITLFVEPSKKFKHYEGIIRIDCRDIAYDRAIKDITKWYESMEEYTPAEVPEYAKLPMYSTWYNFHQNIYHDEIEKECKIAKDLGFKSIILDDGWQTDDSNRGYAYCGDWKVCEKKFPNMKKHVEKIHQLGMKYLMWYSVPFIGFKAGNYERFKDKVLYNIDDLQAGVLDPRYPEVREYLINVYESALTNWNIDGFKLDFVDQFDLRNASSKALKPDAERDTESVQEAVDILLKSIMDRLRSIKPDIMIEFRQRYIGPCMRKYGNIFRVMDCPQNAITNRVGSVDLRLFSGNTAVHADPIMWSSKDTVENAALQFINPLFSVPQVSVILEKLPKEHMDMVKFWIDFSIKHRDVLIDGELTAKSPEAQYPVIIGENNKKRLIALYDDMYIKTGTNTPDKLIIVNGAMTEEVILIVEECIEGIMQSYDCKGNLVNEKKISLKSGICKLEIEKSGVLEILVNR